MIEGVSHNSGTSPAADLTQKSASAKTLRHTPFGDVMVDEISPPRLAGISSSGRSDARSATSAARAAVATSTARAALATSAARAAVATSAARAAVATSAARAAVATSTARAAVATSTAQAAVATSAARAAVATSAARAAVATPTARAAVATPTAQAAVAASTAQAAVATPTAQAAVATPTAQAAVTADAPAQDAAPTAESVFGPDPWLANPTGIAPNGSVYSYNPLYFATAATAAQVAQMVGGTVVASNQLADAGGFAQNQPNEMVQLSNGALINPGLVATFYTHGFPQSYIDRLIHNEIEGA